MNESAQIEETETKETAPAAALYRTEASQTFEYIVEQNSEEFETAHVFRGFTDQEYLAWIAGWDVKVKADGEADQKYSEATCKFWDAICESVKNIDCSESDWKAYIPASEKLESIGNLLAVAIRTETASGVRKLGASDTQKVLTEAYFSGMKPENVVVQTHVLTLLNREEFRKKYNRIQRKRFKQEKIGGLRKQPSVVVVPQDEAVGQLYDEMCLETTGFEGAVPLRFKTTVIDHIFDSALNEKK